MVGTSAGFTGERAPCGKRVNGHTYHEDDGSGILCNDVVYDCGCRKTVHEFHDGSCRTRIIRHDGKIVEDEFTRD